MSRDELRWSFMLSVSFSQVKRPLVEIILDILNTTGL